VILPLRASSGDADASSGGSLVRYVYLELTASGSGLQIPFLGSFFAVEWGLLLRREASDPLLRDEVMAVSRPPERSAIEVHGMPGVSLMAIQNLEVPLSAWVSASCFFLGVLLLHLVARRSTKQRRLQLAMR
jgi:hypothetical protein